jgi:1-acyl-sn-glycerol-3-phosphate acyltransferase
MCSINVLITKMATAPFVDVRMKGLDNIVPGQTYCIAANHTSALDAFVMALLGDKSNFRSIIKHTLKFYPVFGEAEPYRAKHPKLAANARVQRAALRIEFTIAACIAGALFYFGGFVFVNRRDPESRTAARAKTRELLNNGVSVLYFPEGTRSAGPMLP